MDWTTYDLVSPSAVKKEIANGEENKLHAPLTGTPVHDKELHTKNREKEETIISPLYGKDGKELEERYVSVSPTHSVYNGVVNGGGNNKEENGFYNNNNNMATDLLLSYAKVNEKEEGKKKNRLADRNHSFELFLDPETEREKVAALNSR